MIKSALIIAAGAGTRLQRKTGAAPKTLQPVCGVPILKRIVLSARRVGIERFVIVTGYEADHIHAAMDGDARVSGLIEWIHNPQWDKPNGLSALCARPALNEPFVLLMADHLFDEKTLYRLIRTTVKPDECVLAVDRKINTVFDLDDATKTQVEGDRLVRIGKNLTEYNAIDTGMFLCSPALFDALEACRRDDGCSLSDGVQFLAGQGKMRVFDIEDRFWQDIDTPEMLRHAETMMLRRLRKPTDGWVSRHLNRPVSTRISRYLVRTPLTPNHVTLITFLVGLLGAWYIAEGSYMAALLGAALFQLSSILDGCDGEVAKLTFRESKYGSWLDTITDNLTYVAFFAGVVTGYARADIDAWVRLLGVGSIALVTLSILVMYYYLLRTGESGSLVRYNEAFEKHAARPRPGWFARTLNLLRLMSKRDFFTALLLCFAVAGRLDWMFWTVTLGGLAMAVAVFISTGRLLQKDRQNEPALEPSRHKAVF